MLQVFQNIFKIPELKKRILITLGFLAVYRFGAHIPTPGVDAQVLTEIFESAQGTVLGMVDMFTGGALKRLTVFALGIMPYISTSIILQLLTVVVPYLERSAAIYWCFCAKDHDRNSGNDEETRQHEESDIASHEFSERARKL